MIGKRIGQTASLGHWRTVGTVVRVLTSLGVVASVSACDLAFQPNCQTGCNMAGGDETFSREVK